MDHFFSLVVESRNWMMGKMYISDLDYLETPSKVKSNSDFTRGIKGGIDITAFSFGFAEGSKTALTFTTTTTTAISFSFNPRLEN